ncbi:hypothetical protein AMTR_s00002p00254150 [Amborella trichopoda]|uniref:Uncharacterized protein n=1 Tax=Amborella trichopoda TaxID=13333 RepID=W1P171_AMBTC|nr:hypothetical protein AMTR_s00002p00254150 [Amborella trichopoda]
MKLYRCNTNLEIEKWPQEEVEGSLLDKETLSGDEESRIDGDNGLGLDLAEDLKEEEEKVVALEKNLQEEAIYEEIKKFGGRNN